MTPRIRAKPISSKVVGRIMRQVGEGNPMPKRRKSKKNSEKI